MNTESSGEETFVNLLTLPMRKVDLEGNMTEANLGVMFDSSLVEAGNLPLLVLGLESICGVVCNGAILLLFCIRPPLLRTASDLFTINLSLVDLIFSGIVLPVVLVTSLLAKSICNGDTDAAMTVEVARSCIVLFGTVAAALGTLLVSLDRGDVTLKPSKRFFTHSKAVFGIASTWCVSSLGLVIAVLPSLLSLDRDSSNSAEKAPVNESRKLSSYIKTYSQNTTSITYLKPKRTCCRSYPCSAGNINACVFQLIFEIPIFIAAMLTIIIVYGKILWSVQRRNKRYMKASQKQRSRFGSTRSDKGITKKPKLCKPNMCCVTKNGSPHETMEPKTDKNANSNKETSTCTNGVNNPQTTPRRNRSAMQYLTTAIDSKKAKKQDSLEDALFVPAGSKSELQDGTVFTKATNASTKATNTSTKERTDFATVAMSVTVVLAIKRMAARKIKERKKKMRHLRKMTFLIVFTFLFCWSPYYFAKLSIVLMLTTQDATNSSKYLGNASIAGNSTADRTCMPDWIFTWTLAVAALSCILNPALYMFSREKIRVEFIKTFFPHCAPRKGGKRQQKQTKYSLCFVCWDAEDNFSGKDRNDAAASMFKTGWQNSQRHQNNRKEKNNCESYHSKEGIQHPNDKSDGGSVAGDKSSKPPLLRWDVVPCGSSDGSCNKWDEAGEENQDVAQNDGLLLAPTRHGRAGSFSARSVDMISCSTTTASIIAEL